MAVLASGGGLWGIAGGGSLGESMKIAIGVVCDGVASCDAEATVAVTIAAGPLNYQGLDPKVSCPEPSA